MTNGPFRNTDKLLHENVDCKIHITEQHALGIDVGGTVIVRDPLDWHRLAKLEQAVESNWEELERMTHLVSIPVQERRVLGDIVGHLRSAMSR